MEIDHIDNNKRNTVAQNLQLACFRDNYLKNPRKLLSVARVCVCVSIREYEDKLARGTGSAELQKSVETEPIFRHWFYAEMLHKEVLEYRDVVDAGAEAAGCSQETIKRYLRKLLSPVGWYEDFPGEDGKMLLRFKAVQAFRLERKELTA